MFDIKLMNKISYAGISQFGKDRYRVGDEVDKPDAILVRSASLHEYEFNNNLKCIARAGAGVNNIPIDRCSEKGIVVFNTPGANANAVKELAICALIMSSRNVIAAVDWVKTLKDKPDEIGTAVEKGKGAFVGPEIEGKCLGVIGLGAVGVGVANAASKMGMEVYGYDPYVSVDAAWNLSRSINHAIDLKTIYEKCDYITLHVPLTPETKNMINSSSIEMMKNGVRILNLARGELVDVDDMVQALNSGKVACHITDFPNAKFIDTKNVICVPHLGASTPESENNCAKMAALEIKDYLENGNIKNSVNLPNVYMDHSGKSRMAIIHKNIPDMLSKILACISGKNLNVNNLMNKSKKDYAYTLIDLNDKATEAVVSEISKVDGVLRVNVIY